MWETIETWAREFPAAAGLLSGIVLSLVGLGAKSALPVIAAPFVPDRERDVAKRWFIYYASLKSAKRLREGALRLRYRAWAPFSKAALEQVPQREGFLPLVASLRKGWYFVEGPWLRISLANEPREPGWEMMFKCPLGTQPLHDKTIFKGLILSFRTDTGEPVSTPVLISSRALSHDEACELLENDGSNAPAVGADRLA